MQEGQGALISSLSYLAVGRESTFKTYNTCAAGLPFISCNLKTTKENKTLEQIETSRTYSKRISMMKKVEGECEFYAYAESTALAYLLQNAFGGTITSATATGETAGGLAFTHTFGIGNFDQANTSLCLNHRKGDSAGGFVFEYNGTRVNELMLTAEIDDALKGSVGLICVDSTQTSNDVASALGTMCDEPLSFVDGRLSVESTLASLTASSFWHVQSVELGLNNALKNDAASGRIGSEVLDVLPPGIVAFTFTMTMRYDTLTAYNAMLNGTTLAAQFEFLGSTLTTSVIRRGLKLTMPKIFVSDAGDPEIGGPDEVLTSELTCHVLRDCSSANGYAMQAELTNDTASY